MDNAKRVIWEDILEERSRQDEQWGGPDHDDEHGVADWESYRRKFERRILSQMSGPFDPNHFYINTRSDLVKVAALAVAQIESLDREYRSPAITGHAALDVQVGGGHYKDLAIQPVEYIQRNKLGFCEGSVVKYVTRHGSKGGAEDIKKAIHFLQLLLEIDYPEEA